MTRTHSIDPSSQRTDIRPKLQCLRSMQHHHLCLKQLTRMLPMEAMPTMSLCGNRVRALINSRPSRLSDALEHARGSLRSDTVATCLLGELLMTGTYLIA